ncbi:hypothetical protein SmJEL517_g04313 [Synchytrium microbalum]|uniref:Calcineurin subunit B n=1 Tax=Synchytrium microbalum TaxID=1806994 RepID=A0A507BZM8_9FUNG|nr:uncharacterized protein SmJEL517_g04313 [Synchytrium microbalum]TPX32581.1 hypothetical protein SmJEL517_g04313 [Synchytrium microbalum]
MKWPSTLNHIEIVAQSNAMMIDLLSTCRDVQSLSITNWTTDRDFGHWSKSSRNSLGIKISQPDKLPKSPVNHLEWNPRGSSKELEVLLLLLPNLERLISSYGIRKQELAAVGIVATTFPGLRCIKLGLTCDISKDWVRLTQQRSGERAREEWNIVYLFGVVHLYVVLVSCGILPKGNVGNAGSQLEDMVNTTNFTAEEIQRLYKRFLKLDKDGSGAIDKEEFLQIPQIASNPLAQRMIAIFDGDGSGSVDFKEFISGLSAFSAKGNREEKLKFAFKVYDIDRDGYISNGELFIVLKMMVGNNLRDNQLQQIVDKTIMEADLDGDGKVSFEEFMKMVEATDVSTKMTVDTDKF